MDKARDAQVMAKGGSSVLGAVSGFLSSIWPSVSGKPVADLGSASPLAQLGRGPRSDKKKKKGKTLQEATVVKAEVEEVEVAEEMAAEAEEAKEVVEEEEEEAGGIGAGDEVYSDFSEGAPPHASTSKPRQAASGAMDSEVYSSPVRGREAARYDTWDHQHLVDYDVLSGIPMTPPSGRDSLYAEDAQDRVKFACYAPLVVARGSRFPLAVWAFLQQQREEMAAHASRVGSVMRGEAKDDLPVSRGDLVTIVLTVPEAVFSARGDGVRRMVWLGSVQHASFLLDVLPSAPSGRHACSASVVCGVHALCMQFSIAVSDTRDVGRAAAVAAASAARHGFVGERGARCVVEGPACGPTADLNLLDTRFVNLPRRCASLDWSLLRFEDKKLASGRHGDVLLATVQSTGRKVVVKQPKVDPHASDSTVVKLFNHEAAAQFFLGRSPNVVELVGITRQPEGSESEASGLPALVLEYAERGSLESLVKAGFNDHSSLLAISRDAACGVSCLHAAGLVHNDLAARNVVVTGDYVGKVADLGLSRRLGLCEDIESDGYGPISWMALEALVPPFVHSPKSDAYSFGVLLWEAFESRCGAAPWASLLGKAVDRKSIVQRLERGDVLPIHNHQDTALGVLMTRCFSRDPRSRPSMPSICCALEELAVHAAEIQVASGTPLPLSAPHIHRSVAQHSDHTRGALWSEPSVASTEYQDFSLPPPVLTLPVEYHAFA